MSGLSCYAINLLEPTIQELGEAFVSVTLTVFFFSKHNSMYVSVANPEGGTGACDPPTPHLLNEHTLSVFFCCNM